MSYAARPDTSDPGSYVFVSYAHADRDALKEIRWLKEQGVRVWHDEGIRAGVEWSEAIAQAIRGASHFVLLVTPRSVASEHCRQELNFALEEKRTIVAVHLEETQLPDGLRLSLNHRQAILKSQLRPDAYRTALLSALAQDGTQLQPTVAKKPHRPGSLPRALVGALTACVAALLIWQGSRSVDPPAPIRTIAVLPLASGSGNLDQAHVADGMTMLLGGELSKVGGLSVIGHQSARQFAGTTLPSAEIAAELGVDGLLTGSILASSGTFHIVLQLVDARSNVSVWSGDYEREQAQVLRMEAEIVNAIVQALQLDAVPERARHVVDPEVFDDYLKALHLMTATRFRAPSPEVVDLLRDVVARDPEFADAWASLGGAQTQLAWATGDERWIAGSRSAAEAALRLNDRLPGAHLTMGWVYENDWDFARASESFERALSLDPSNPVTLVLYAYHLRDVDGNFRRALTLSERALRLDPLNAGLAARHADHLLVTRHYQQSFDALAELPRRSHDLEQRLFAALDRDVAWHRAEIDMWRACGNPCKEALEAVTELWRQGGKVSVLEGRVAFFGESSEFGAKALAAVRAALGELELSLGLLREDYDGGNPGLRDLRAQPRWDVLRAEPAWGELLNDIGYPPVDPDPGVLADVGRALAFLGRGEEAEVRIERALAVAPQDTRSDRWRVSMAYVHFARSQHGAAIEWAERALRADAGSLAAADANLLLAVVHALDGRMEGAQEHYASALDLWPTFDAEHPPIPSYATPDFRSRYLEGLNAVAVQ